MCPEVKHGATIQIAGAGIAMRMIVQGDLPLGVKCFSRFFRCGYMAQLQLYYYQ